MATTTYVDANLHHDQGTGRAVTACLHIVNGTPFHWHTKRQSTVETATFGSEIVAARIATDQIIDLRYTLMYLGVPVRSRSYMFGDNKSVVDSASQPTSTLSKKSTLASYHRVTEAIAAGYPPPPCPRNQLWPHIIESEKPLLQDVSNSTGKMENTNLQTFSANIGSLQKSGPS